jgi:tetratricopeptide (TPR) repeat protein
MELAPGLAEAHTARGVSLLAQERYDEAAAQFERAVTQNPRSFDAWYQYARTALHQGALEKALELFEKASDVDPDDYQSPLIAAPVYRKLGYEAKALEAERRGVALAEGHLQSYPDNARAYFPRPQRSIILVKVKAFDWADRAIAAIDPTMPPRAITSRAFAMRRWRCRQGVRFPAGFRDVAQRGSTTTRNWTHPRRSAFHASAQDAQGIGGCIAAGTLTSLDLPYHFPFRYCGSPIQQTRHRHMWLMAESARRK